MQARNGTIIVFALGIALAACTRSASTAKTAKTAKTGGTTTAATYEYSCCQSGDIDSMRHAGDAVTVHWIVTAAATTTRRSTPVTLSASLTGPFADVGTLKRTMSASRRPAATIVAVPVQTTDQAGGAPVSTLDLPANAASGYYDLATSVASDGTVGGATIIDVR